MRVLVQIKHVDIVQLDVEVLVDRFQRAADANIVFELDCDDVIREGLEEATIRNICKLARPLFKTFAEYIKTSPEEQHVAMLNAAAGPDKGSAKMRKIRIARRCPSLAIKFSQGKSLYGALESLRDRNVPRNRKGRGCLRNYCCCARKRTAEPRHVRQGHVTKKVSKHGYSFLQWTKIKSLYVFYLIFVLNTIYM